MDGGSRGNPGPASWAFVLKDDADGEVIERTAFMGQATNNVAEYTALLELLDYATAHQFKKLKVYSDSELMVRQISGVYKVKNADLLPLYEEAKELIEQLQSFEIIHVRRELNKRADELCNKSLDAEEKKLGVAAPEKKAKAKPTASPAQKDLRERCLPLIEFYAEDWRNGSPVKPFSEMLLKELLNAIEGKNSED